MIRVHANHIYLIDFLEYKSWWYQIHWYGMSYEAANSLYPNAKNFKGAL